MQEELDGFAAFYGEKHQGHKIEWDHALGTVSLRARFAAGQKELSVSLYQAVVLLLFNDMTEMPFSDVKLHTGIGASPRVTSNICICIFPDAFYATRSFRGRSFAVHAPKLGMREEKGAQEKPSRKRCQRRGRVCVQRCVRGFARQGAHQHYSSEGDCKCPISLLDDTLL